MENYTKSFGKISAINAKQIQVTFNKPVNETSAETIGNYYLGNGAAPVALTSSSSASLQSDNKTVVITLGTALTNKIAYSFKVSGIKDIDGAVLASDYNTSFIANDTTAPAFVSATATAKTTTNTITITFSEPIDKSSAAVTVNGTFASLAAGTDPTQVVATTGSSLTAGTTYTLNLMNFKDAAGNYMATNPQSATVTVAGDVVAPNVTNVAFVRDNKLEVSFDKAMNISTLTANTNVRLLDSTLTAGSITLGAPSAADTTNKVFDFAVSGLTFNTSNAFNGIVVLGSSIADLSGNTLTALTRNVSVIKDTTAPQVVSAVYKNVATYGTSDAACTTAIATAHGCIVVKFNEPVTASALNTAYSVVDNNGASITTPISAVTVNTSDNTELVLTLSADVVSGTTSYLVLIPTNAAKDLSLLTNGSLAVNKAVDVSAGVPVASDTTAPSITNGTVTTNAAGATATAVKTITVPFVESGSGLDLSTVVNTNNYRLDGMPLPAGSYVTVSTTTATINIPAGSIAADKVSPTGYIFNVTGVKDKAGNTMSPYVGNITLYDDVAPVLKTAVINSTDGSLSLGFSENVNAVTADTAKDFTVVLNGSTLLAGTTPAWTVAAGTGADAGKYVLSVNTRIVGVAADGSGVVTAWAGKTYAGTANNVMKFTYIDVDGSGTLTTGDIVLSAVDQGTTTAITDAVSGTYNLNNASSLSISTVASPATVKDVSHFTNALTGATAITVK